VEDRIARLERANRLLVLALVALVAFCLGAVTRGEAPLGLPSAAAQPEMQTYSNQNERPNIIFTASDSGSTIYEFVKQDDGSYRRKIWSSG
jgi:hypothetical protein